MISDSKLPQQVFNYQLYEILFRNSSKSKPQVQQQAIVDRYEEQPINIHQSYFSANALIIFRVVALVVLTYRFSIESYTSFFLVLVYLTDLGFNLTWIYFTLVCFDFILSKILKSTICPRLGAWINLLYEVVFCFQFPITIIFWSLLFDFSAQHTTSQIFRELGVHGFPCFCLTFDFIFNVYVFPLKHLAIVVSVGVIYLTINLGYSLAIAPVYDPIDWVSFMSYVWIIVCLIIILLIHRLAHYIWQNCKKQKIETIRINTNQQFGNQS